MKILCLTFHTHFQLIINLFNWLLQLNLSFPAKIALVVEFSKKYGNLVIMGRNAKNLLKMLKKKSPLTFSPKNHQNRCKRLKRTCFDIGDNIGEQ